MCPDDILNEIKSPLSDESDENNDCDDYKLFNDIINDPIDIPKPVSPVTPISIKDFPSFKLKKPSIYDIKNNVDVKSVTDIMTTTTFITLNFLQSSLNSKISTCKFILTRPNIDNNTKTIIRTYINDLNGFLNIITFIISEYTKERILPKNMLSCNPLIKRQKVSK